MPWQEVTRVSLGKEFVLLVLQAGSNRRELCRRFGIAPKTGYKWLGRYYGQEPAGLYDLPRAPHRVPWAISAEQVGEILGVRHAHPSWGPKKLRAKLLQGAAEQAWPACRI